MTDKFFGLPKGACLVIIVEFWERFSFYGMLAIFVLFLSASPETGGFGWSKADALALAGLYTGLMYGLPFFGGLVADKFISRRLAVGLGLTLMTLGHFLLALPAILPGLMLDPAGVNLLHADDAVLGQWSLPEGAQESAEMLKPAYQAITLSFWAAIGLLVIGNGLMKATLAILLADQFDLKDANRAVGFTYFYLSISVGALLAGLTIGTLGERVGWHYGFTLAGVGVLTALISYLYLAPRWLKTPTHNAAEESGVSEDVTRDRYLTSFVVVGCAGFAMAVFMASWFQMFGSWAVFTNEEIDRRLFGIEVPVSWFISINSAVIIAFAPVIAVILKRVAESGRDVDYFAKISLSVLLAAAAHAVMYIASQSGLTWLILPVIAIILISLGEVNAWVPAYDFVYKAAPSGLQTTIMGTWYLFALGLSGYVAGQIGVWGQQVGFEIQSLATSATLVAVLIALLLARPWLVKLADKVGLET